MGEKEKKKTAVGSETLPTLIEEEGAPRA